VVTDGIYQLDADSHITEGAGSWETYLVARFAHRRPALIHNPNVSNRPLLDQTWYIDGRLVPRNQGAGGVVMSTPVEMSFSRKRSVRAEVQACTDPAARADAMRTLGIDRTVLYSTLFLEAFCEDIAYEAALMSAWNRWMADMCSIAPEQLTYGAPVPIRETSLAIEVAREAKELGAAAVMVLPAAGDRLLHDPILDPFWAACQDLDIPVAVHIGWPQPTVTNMATTPSSIFLGAFETSMWWGYLSFLTGGILNRYPRLRVAFLEHDAKWLELFLERSDKWYPTAAAAPWPSTSRALDTIREHRVYFSFDGDYSYMPRFLEIAGEERVLGALDFPHTHYGVADLSAAFDFIRNHVELNDEQRARVLGTNGLAYYGWEQPSNRRLVATSRAGR
jgi:predicted TIM-barrel fold metal-dependent hydrolase